MKKILLIVLFVFILILAFNIGRIMVLLTFWSMYIFIGAVIIFITIILVYILRYFLKNKR